MLRPADGVTDGAGLVGSGGGAEGLGDIQENVSGHAAGLFNHRRRVAGEVPLQHLVHAPRMLERGIGLEFAGVAGFTATIFAVSAAGLGMTRGFAPGFLVLRTFVEPRFWTVLFFPGIPAGEEAVEIFSI